MSIDIHLLRTLGNDPRSSKEDLMEACLQAADQIEELCRLIEGTVRVAADALKQNRGIP